MFDNVYGLLSRGMLPCTRVVGATLLAAAIAAVHVGTGSFDTRSASAQTTATTVIAPSADAFVHQGYPTKNYGNAQILSANVSPTKQSFLRFDVGALNGSLVSAKMRLYAVNGSSAANGTIKRITNTTWNENTITYATRPALDGAIIGSFNKVVNGTWLEYDVTSVVNAPGAYSFALTQTGTDGVNIASRENSTVYIPQLVVRTSAASPSPTPTPKPSATPAPTAQPSATPQPTSVPASPSSAVVGYGAKTVGGTGGQVVTVTSLADTGAGTLRDALAKAKATPGGEIIRFAVAGTIDLNGDLEIAAPYLTIDGSTAPGGGIQIKGGMLKVVPPAHDVIFRYLKVRSGDKANSSSNDDRDAIFLNGLQGRVYNVVIDHCTLIWGPDIGGLAILGNVEDVTVQYTIMGEGLYLSNHYEGVEASGQQGHSMGASVFQLRTDVAPARRLTYYRNLFTTADRRMPVVQGAEQVDLINNVMYNWNRNPPGGNPRSLNMVGNVLQRGPQTRGELVVWRPQPHSANPSYYPQSVYEANNLTMGFPYARGDAGSTLYRSSPIGTYSVQPGDAMTAYNDVLAQAGAALPVRDTVDTRIINNVRNGTNVLPNGVDQGRFPNGMDLVWPNLSAR